MAEETLLSAARRAVRFFNIDMNGHGGLISKDTEHAMETLDRMITLQIAREKTIIKLITHPLEVKP